MTYTPGPGDILGQYAGHPNDPRAPEDDSDDTTAKSIADARCFLVVAELAAKRGEIGKAREALRKAMLSIEELLS